MEAVFDDYAATPPAFTPTRPMMLQPELNSRFSWLEGQQAAGNWELIIRDDAAGDGGNLTDARLILCPADAEGPSNEVFAADFENGDNGFTHSGIGDEWEIGLPATVATTTSNPIAGLANCAQGGSCFKTDLDGTYEASSSQDLISPPISLAGLRGRVFAAWEQWYQMESATFDHMSVSVEEDGGANPRPLFSWIGATMTTTAGSPAVNIPTAAGWGLHRANISDYAGKTIRLRFHVDADSTIQLAGLAIDAVRVYEKPEPSLARRAPQLSGLKIKPSKFRVVGASSRRRSEQAPAPRAARRARGEAKEEAKRGAARSSPTPTRRPPPRP